jgi:hypothetical protein
MLLDLYREHLLLLHPLYQYLEISGQNQEYFFHALCACYFFLNTAVINGLCVWGSTQVLCFRMKSMAPERFQKVFSDRCAFFISSYYSGILAAVGSLYAMFSLGMVYSVENFISKDFDPYMVDQFELASIMLFFFLVNHIPAVRYFFAQNIFFKRFPIENADQEQIKAALKKMDNAKGSSPHPTKRTKHDYQNWLKYKKKLVAKSSKTCTPK